MMTGSLLKTDRITTKHSIKLIDRATQDVDGRGQIVCTVRWRAIGSLAHSGQGLEHGKWTAGQHELSGNRARVENSRGWITLIESRISAGTAECREVVSKAGGVGLISPGTFRVEWAWKTL